MTRKKGLGIFGFLLGSRVRLSLKEANQYLIHHSDEDSERIIGATLNGKTDLDFSVKEVKRWRLEKEKRDRQNDLLHKTSALNNKGIDLEKEGKIEDVIEVYEKNIKTDYPAHHAYKRLMVLYRRRKDYDNEERVILRAINTFAAADEYRARLDKCRILNKKQNIN